MFRLLLVTDQDRFDKRGKSCVNLATNRCTVGGKHGNKRLRASACCRSQTPTSKWRILMNTYSLGRSFMHGGVEERGGAYVHETAPAEEENAETHEAEHDHRHGEEY